MRSDICRTCKNYKISCEGKSLYNCKNYKNNTISIKDLTDETLIDIFNNGLNNLINLGELQYFYNEVTEEIKRRNIYDF